MQQSGRHLLLFEQFLHVALFLFTGQQILFLLLEFQFLSLKLFRILRNHRFLLAQKILFLLQHGILLQQGLFLPLQFFFGFLQTGLIFLFFLLPQAFLLGALLQFRFLGVLASLQILQFLQLFFLAGFKLAYRLLQSLDFFLQSVAVRFRFAQTGSKSRLLIFQRRFFRLQIRFSGNKSLIGCSQFSLFGRKSRVCGGKIRIRIFQRGAIDFRFVEARRKSRFLAFQRRFLSSQCRLRRSQIRFRLFQFLIAFCQFLIGAFEFRIRSVQCLAVCFRFAKTG